MKQAISLVLSLVFAGVSALSALATGTSYDDVPATAWYARAVRYVSEKGLMSGTGAGNFSPDTPMTRAMLTAVLCRNEGQPPVVDIGAFWDVQGSWYASAANWAAASGIVSGYGNGRFGGEDSVTRQDMATILWRYAGSPAAPNSRDFADEASIASYAATAVDWARANGIVTGKTVIPFCTSASSGLGQSGTLLADMAGTGDWQEGQRFSSGASESTVAAWVESLDK